MELTPNDKASLAGSWLSKRLILQMSVEVAALVMGVSQGLVTKHRKLQEPASLPVGMLVWGLMTATTDELTAVFTQHEDLVWAALDRATNPQR